RAGRPCSAKTDAASTRTTARETGRCDARIQPPHLRDAVTADAWVARAVRADPRDLRPLCGRFMRSSLKNRRQTSRLSVVSRAHLADAACANGGENFVSNTIQCGF